MLNEEQVQQIELTATEAREYIKFAEDAQKLLEHPLFKKVVTEGYMTNEAIRLTKLLADTNMQSPDNQKGIMDGLMGISQLNNFFVAIGNSKMMMQRSLAECENALQQGEVE